MSRAPFALRRRATLLTTFALLIVATGTNAGTANAAPNDGCGVNPFCYAGSGLASVASQAAGGTFEKIVSSMAESMGKLLEMALSWWLVMPSPKLRPDGAVGVLATVKDYTYQLQIVGLIVSLVMVGVRMAMSRKGLVEESEQVWTALVRAVFGATMFASLVVALTAVGDAISSWILQDAVLKGQSAEQIIKTVGLASITGGQVAGPQGAIFPIAGLGIIALVGFLGALLQVILLVVRQVMLIVVVCFVPVAATWSGTGPGSQSYDKLKAWTIAFLLFKPVGACVYLIAFSAAGTKDDDFQMKLLGIILLAMVAFVLPSLMRMIMPAVSAMGAGGSGLAAAGMAAGAAMAAGKVAGLAATGGASGAATAGSTSVTERGAGGPLTMGGGGGPGGGGPGPTEGLPGPDGGGGGGPGGGDAATGAGPQQALSDTGGGSGGGEAAAAAGSVARQINQAAETESSAGESGGTPPPTLGRPELSSGYGEHQMKG